MKEMSNHTIAVLLVITIISSLSATFISLTYFDKIDSGAKPKITGMALAPNGSVTLDIGTTASIKFSAGANTVAFSTGQIGAGYTNCTITTLPGSNSAGCTNFLTPNNGFTIENDGNTNLSVEMQSNRTALQFIGSPGARFLWNVTINESGACFNSSDDTAVSPNTSGGNAGGCGGVWASCGSIFESVVTSYKTICPRLRYEDGYDQLNIDINITIPGDATTGDKVAGLTVRGTTVTKS